MLFRQSPIVFEVNLQNPVSMQPQIVRKYTIIYNMAHMLLPTFALEYSCRFTSPGSALHKCSRNLSLQRFLTHSGQWKGQDCKIAGKHCTLAKETLPEDAQLFNACLQIDVFHTLIHSGALWNSIEPTSFLKCRKNHQNHSAANGMPLSRMSCRRIQSLVLTWWVSRGSVLARPTK